MQILLFSDEKAQKYVKRIVKNKPELQSLFVNRWIEETGSVKCYLLVDEKNVFSIALLSKMDFDQENIHSKPFMLDYIYTFSEYRRQKFAYKMLSYLKKKNKCLHVVVMQKVENYSKHLSFLLLDIMDQLKFTDILNLLLLFGQILRNFICIFLF